MTDEIRNAIQKFDETKSLDQLRKRTPFEQLVALVSKTVASSSARVYNDTYKSWVSWCDGNDIDTLDLHPGNVIQFIDDTGGTMATRNRNMSAMRSLAEIMAILDGEQARTMYELLKKMKPPKPSKESELTERNKTALTPAQVDVILRVWSDDSKLSRRNMAIIATLAETGMRRSELASLQWRDIDLERAVIHVRHGKGDKDRDVSIINGVGGFAVRALRVWKSITGDRKYVFCPIVKGDKLGSDKPSTDKTIYYVVENTGKIAGIEFTPHDLRRTWITEYLATGGAIANAQKQVGHESESTTLSYAQSVDAETRIRGANMRYGTVTAHDKELFD